MASFSGGKTFKVPVRPRFRDIKGKRYFGPIVMKVNTWDEMQRPKDVTIGYDDTVFNVEDGMHFCTGFIAAEMIEDATKVKA